MEFQIITNNPMVRDKFSDKLEIHYYDMDHKALLKKVRDEIQLGYRLLSHPLSGSVKPNETPYKSVMISKAKSRVDADSVRIIEESIAVGEKFVSIDRVWTEEVLNDFRLIDFTLIESAIEPACRSDRV